MYLSYGSYVFPSGEASFTITKNARFSPRGVLDTVVERWNVSGVLLGSTQAELTTKINTLRNALAINNQDLVFWQDDGSISAHALLMSQAQGGIRVTDLNFPEPRKAQYATGRTYQFTVEAEYPNVFSGLLAFQETVSLIGSGGPRYVYVECINGPPQRQIVAQQTLYRATQSGQAIGKGAYPTAPNPLWPSLEDADQRVFTRVGGELIGGVYTNFQVQWGYSFTSDTPFNNPNPTLA